MTEFDRAFDIRGLERLRISGGSDVDHGFVEDTVEETSKAEAEKESKFAVWRNMSYSEFCFRDWLDSILPDPLWEEFKQIKENASSPPRPEPESRYGGKGKDSMGDTDSEQMPEGLKSWKSTFSSLYNGIKEDLARSNDRAERGAEPELEQQSVGQAVHGKDENM